MKRTRPIMWLLLTTLLLVPQTGKSQGQTQSFTINGQSGSVPVIQMNGRSYVDLEALARAVNGTLSFNGSQISLSLPGGSAAPAASTAAPAAAPAPAPNPGFSPGFMRAGIEEMATIREWHTALATTIEDGYPIEASSFASYRALSATNLRLASVAVSTDSDSSAYQLLSNVFQNMGKLTDKYVAARANMNFISPDALNNDGLNQRIVACGHSLAAMAASGQFVDDGSCH